jgi:succinyl-diaminopimelate desuccinylase
LLDGLAQRRPGFRYSLRDLLEVRPSMTEPDRPVVLAASAAVKKVLGREAAIICSPGTYDQKHIDRIGHLRDCVAYGPGILELAHQPDEYVEIADMTASAKVMALAAHALLTGG